MRDEYGFLRNFHINMYSVHPLSGRENQDGGMEAMQPAGCGLHDQPLEVGAWSLAAWGAIESTHEAQREHRDLKWSLRIIGSLKKREERQEGLPNCTFYSVTAFTPATLKCLF